MAKTDLMDFAKKYVDVLHPATFRSAIASEAKKDDAKLTFLHVLLISSFGILTLVAYVAMYTTIMDQVFTGPGVEVPPEVPLLRTQMMASITPLSLATNFLTSIISFYAINALLFVILRAMGGKGRLGNQLYVVSTVMVGISVLYAVSMLLALGPLLSCVSVPLMLLLMLYAVYLTYVCIRAVHRELDMWRALAAMLLQAMIIALAVFALGKLFGQ